MSTFNSNDSSFEILFLGTGASTGVPELGHVLRKTCHLCTDANINITSKNRRNNVSIAIIFKSKAIELVNDKEITKYNQRCIIIDAGKTMRDAMLRHLHNNNIKQIDGLILTHGHADACFGLDDVRDLQTFEKVVLSTGDIGCRVVSGPLPIYLHKETMNVVESVFDYLVNPPEYYTNVPEGTDILKRRVALLNFNVIDCNESIQFQNLKVQCFPVYHGGTYISLGFAIGQPSSEVVYISDVKIIPDETWVYLKSLSTIKLLVLDMLSETGIYSHFGLQEALDVIDILKPQKALFTGMVGIFCSIYRIEVDFYLHYDILCYR